MNDQVSVSVTVNGAQCERTVEPRLLLSDFLRHDLETHGTVTLEEASEINRFL